MQKKIRVLVLGHRGLLGNMVKSYLEKNPEILVITNQYRWPNEEFKKFIIESNPDFIINCIGAIHQKTSDFKINLELPIWLNEMCSCKIVHPGTDCEMDIDPYGLSKKSASEYIKRTPGKTKIIKTSIIGPEIGTSYSLMGWFLGNTEGSSVNGFTNHLWNGNTTLTWAEYCLKMIKNWDNFKEETILFSECVSKYELLCLIADVYCRKINVIKDERPGVNKCLDGHIKTEHIKDQLEKLKLYAT